MKSQFTKQVSSWKIRICN